MTKIESVKVEVGHPADKVFNYLADFNNFQSLMPPQVSNWTSTSDTCSFTINGMATIGMKIVEKTPHTQLKITSNGKVPFDFTLTVFLQALESSKTGGYLLFEADINPMLKMMVEKPLTNFFNLLAQRLKDIPL